MDATKLLPALALLLAFQPSAARAQAPPEDQPVIDFGRHGAIVVQERPASGRAKPEVSVCAASRAGSAASGVSCASRSGGPPLTAVASPIGSTVDQDFEDLGPIVFGLVSPDVATVEVVLANGSVRPARLERRTVLGVPGIGVFGLVAQRSRVRLVRLLDAAGRLLWASDPDFTERIVRAPRTIARVDDQPLRTLRSRSTGLSFLQPGVPFTAACAEYRQARACMIEEHEARTLRTVRWDSGRACSGTSVVALVPSRGRRARFVLGTGARRTVPVRSLEGGLPIDARAAAASFPPELAIRRVDVLDAAGRVVVSEDLGLAPSYRSCGTRHGGGWTAYVGDIDGGAELAPTTSTVVDDGPPAVHLGFGSADTQRLACVAAGRLPTFDDCLADFPGAFQVAATPAGPQLSGLVEAPVTAASVVLTDGRRVGLRVAPDPERLPAPLTGRARTALGVLPAGSVIKRIELRTAEGRLATDEAFAFGTPTFGPARLVASAAGYRLTRRSARFHAASAQTDCLEITGPGDTPSEEPECGLPSLSYFNDCATRRIVVYGALERPSTRGLLLETTTGSRVTLRPRTVGPEQRRVLFGVVPRNAGVRRALRLTRDGARTMGATSVLSPRRQCGYADELGSFDSAGPA